MDEDEEKRLTAKAAKGAKGKRGKMKKEEGAGL